MNAVAEQQPMTRVASLNEICCDPRAFPREGLDPGRVDEFVAPYRDELPTSNDPFPPFGCVEDRDGALWCYDGWHRLAARKRVVAERSGLVGEIPVQFVRAGNRTRLISRSSWRLNVPRSVRGH